MLTKGMQKDLQTSICQHGYEKNDFEFSFKDNSPSNNSFTLSPLNRMVIIRHKNGKEKSYEQVHGEEFFGIKFEKDLTEKYFDHH